MAGREIPRCGLRHRNCLQQIRLSGLRRVFLRCEAAGSAHVSPRTRDSAARAGLRDRRSLIPLPTETRPFSGATLSLWRAPLQWRRHLGERALTPAPHVPSAARFPRRGHSLRLAGGARRKNGCSGACGGPRASPNVRTSVTLGPCDAPARPCAPFFVNMTAGATGVATRTAASSAARRCVSPVTWRAPL
jgi:hypothetical protein